MKQKLLLTSALVASLSFVQAQEIATWKGFRTAAVTYSFDDNWGNQIDCVKKYFDPHGYKATFNVVTNWVNGGNSHGTSWDSWKQMAQNGHEIASHSDSHQQYTPASECSSSKNTIEGKIGKPCVTFAYPNCNRPSGGLDVYISGRVCNGQVESKNPQDFFNIGSIICGNQGINDSNSFIQKMNQAKNSGGWVTFLIHGVDSGDYSPTSSSAISGSINHIAQNDKDFWCCTFAAASKYIKERQSAKASLKSSSSSSLTFTLTDNCDDKIFDEPLSLRYKNPGWSTVSGTQGGKKIEASIKDGYIYFDATPDAGDIVLSGDGSSAPVEEVKTPTTEVTPGTQTSAFDPCSVTPSVGSGQKVDFGGGNQKIGTTQSGYSYELWRNGGGSGSITLYNQEAAFKAEWNNAGDYLGRVGKSWSNKPSVDNLGGNLVVNYQFTKSGDDGGSYSYVGIYGWMDNPQIEYYIVDDWLHDRGTPGGSYIGKQIGTIKVDGEDYAVWTGTRTGESKWGNSTFTQIFSIRQSRRQCGTIHISEHFRQWKKLGLDLGGLMEAQILAEAGGGQGYVDFKYATMEINDDSSDGNDGSSSSQAEPTEAEGPYKGAIVIPGKLECENYDKGGNGFGYKDSDSKNEGGEYRNDGVDIVTGGSGYAVGYTTSSEWLKYTINVEEDGEYTVGAYMANGSSDPEISLSVDGKKVVSLTGTGAGDWDTYSLATGKVTLSKGEHTLKINFDNNYTNIDYVQFSKGNIEEKPSTQDPTTTTTSGGTFFDENGAYYGPSCDNTNYTGAFYTGDYTSPFKTILGKSDEDIQKKLDQLWNHYFKGDNNSKVYYEDNNGAYIEDIGNNDVRSEGMSYGMMICVQTNHKTEFDKIWNWAKKNMWHNPNQGGDGYFSWSCYTNGSVRDRGCAPDGELYFMASLLLAANRWNDSQYMADAQAILKSCWKGSVQSLFNESTKIITFQPSEGNSDFSDPSYDLPAFVELFARWSNTNNDKWSQALTATRDHLYKSCNTQSGLFTDYNNFDGTPKSVSFNSNASKYMYDAMRCAMNYGMDYYLFGKDAKRQEEMAKRIIDFFEKDGYSHARFNWDGSGASEQYTLGETGANAVACYCLMNNSNYKKQVEDNLKRAWNASLMTGQQRYYDGLVHYLSMLHLCGAFKIWKPAPDLSSIKEIEAKNEYNGVVYEKDAQIYDWKDCELVKVTIKVDKDNVNDVDADEVAIVPNPASTMIQIVSDDAIESVTLVDMLGRKVVSTTSNVVSVSELPEGIYSALISTENAQIVKKVMIKR